MNNESFDIPQHRDAPTQDCKGKSKVYYSSFSRKLKKKGVLGPKKALQVRSLMNDKYFFPKEICQ